MGYLKYIKKIWKKPKENFGSEAWRDWLVKLRAEPALVRLEHPTRPDRARELGYKAKQGIFVARARVTKGLRKRPDIKGGRRPKRNIQFMAPRKSARWIAEEHTARKYPNAEVLNSYWVGEDGNYKWYEVILADRVQCSKYEGYEWLASPANRGRVFRGLTSAGKESRGLHHKGKDAVKFRPSKRAHGIK